MEREYLRFGIAGIFISRLLPGFRSFVAPFAGLANLSPAKTLIPIAAAATLWYGFLVYVGVQLGEEWEAINHLVSRLNRTLAIIGGLLLVGLVLWMLLRRRRTRHDRLRSRFQEAWRGPAPAVRTRLPLPGPRPSCSSWLRETSRFREKTCSR
jgi:Uncharacterized membrane-associated protein